MTHPAARRRLLTILLLIVLPLSSLTATRAIAEPASKSASASESSAAPTTTEASVDDASSRAEGASDGNGSVVSPATEEMLKALVQKGIITLEEYEKIYRREAEYQTGKEEENALPGWLANWTFGGDLRLRWDRVDFGDEFRPSEIFTVGQDNVNLENNTGTGVRNRFSLRMRLGAEKKLSDDFAMGIRIRTAPTLEAGGNVLFDNGRFPRRFTGDPRSADVTFGGFFESKPIGIDLAYLRWNPTVAPGLRVTAGKIPNPFLSGEHLAERIVWDWDINPEGLAAQYGFEFVPGRLRMDMAAGAFILDEVPGVTLEIPVVPEDGSPTIAPSFDERDPFMWGLQAGFTGTPVSRLKANVRASYYELQQLNTEFVAIINDSGNGGDAVDENPLFVLSSAPTSAASEGRLRQIAVDGYFEYPFFNKSYLTLRPFWFYSQILTADDDNDAWAAGFAFGDPHYLRFTALYGDIRRNGTISMFTDSAIFDGLTNVQGWYLQLERRVTRFMTVRGSFSKTRASEQTCLVTLTEPETCDTAFASAPALLEQFRTTQRDRVRWQIDVMVEF